MTELEEQRLSELHVLRAENPNLFSQYEQGTEGYHELVDRAYVALGVWETYIANHPACLIDEDRYAEATAIGTMIHDFYQKLNEKEDLDE